MAPTISSLLGHSAAGRLARRTLAPLRRRARRAMPRAGILMYHRVTHEAVDPWGLCVTPGAFDAQMAVLARHRAAIDLAGFADGSAFTADGGRIAVTFDDAYIDNLTDALPILEKYEIPATIFIVSQALGRRREFWWDALVRAVLESGPLPAELTIELGGEMRSFRVDDQPGDGALAAHWNADEDAPRTARERLYLDLWSVIVALAPDAQDAAVDTVLAWAGQPVIGPEARYPAAPEQIAALAQHPLVRIGSHTRHHVSLPDLPGAAQRGEIEGGHRELEALIGRRIDRFSYPFGRYDAVARGHVQALGIDVACTSVPRAVVARDNRAELSRLQSIERDGDAFARWLHDDHALLGARGS